MQPAELQRMQALLHQHLEALEHVVDSGRLLERSLTSFSPQPPLSRKWSASALELGLPVRGREESDTCVCLGSDSPCPNFPHKSVVAKGLSLSDRLKSGRPVPSEASSPRQGTLLHVGQRSSEEEIATLGVRTSTRKFSSRKWQLVEPLLSGSLPFNEVEAVVKQDSAGENQSEQSPIEDSTTSKSSWMHRSPSSLMNYDITTARSKAELEQLWKKKEKMSIVEKEAKLEKDKYNAEGLGQRIRLSTPFNLMCFFAILANALWVGIQLDLNQMGDQQNLTTRIIDNLFCVWFTIELVIWFFAFKSMREALTHWRFMVSAFIVVGVVWTLWVAPLTGFHIWGLDYKDSSLLQVLRLTRIAKLSRNFAGGQGLPNILFQATAILKGLKATAPLLLLYSLIVYIFAVFFRWLLTDREHFDTVPKAFHFLFWSALGNVDKTIFSTMLDAGWGPWVLFVAFTIIGNLTVAKMLTGLLLQVVMKMIDEEKQISDTAALEHTIAKVAKTLDKDKDGSVSIAEFESLLVNRELLQSMADHDVDVASFLDFTRTSFPSDGQLFVADLVRSAKQFCGFKPASVKDMVNLRKLMYVEVELIIKGQAKLLETMQAIMGKASTNPFSQSHGCV